MKSVRERQGSCKLTYTWNLKTQKPETNPSKPELRDTENRLVVAGSGGWEWAKSRGTNFRFYSKSWGLIIHGLVTTANSAGLCTWKLVRE